MKQQTNEELIIRDVYSDILTVLNRMLAKKSTEYNKGVIRGLETAVLFINHHTLDLKVIQARKGNIDNE
jgi:hypothetical protein